MQTTLALNARGASAVVEDFVALNASGRTTSVGKAIKMIADLREHGRECRYLKHAEGEAYELKTRTPEGGVRVYLYFHGAAAVICRAEVKREDRADQDLIAWTLTHAAETQAGRVRIQ